MGPEHLGKNKNALRRRKEASVPPCSPSPLPPPRYCRRLAATADAAHPECPRAALYIIAALPNVKDAAIFQLVRGTYISTVKRLAPAGEPGVCRRRRA